MYLKVGGCCNEIAVPAVGEERNSFPVPTLESYPRARALQIRWAKERLVREKQTEVY